MGRAIKLVIYYFIYQLLFTVPATLVAGMLHWDSISAVGIGMILSGVVMIWHLIHFKYVSFSMKSFGEVSKRTIGLSLPFILAGMVFFNLTSEFLDLPDTMEDTFLGMSRNVFGIISVAIMAPLVEELLFRGAIQGYLLRKGMKPLHAILIASLIFGLIHMNWAQIPFAFAIGLIFGWLYYRTGSLVPGIIGHFINNSLSAITMASMTKEEFNTPTTEWIGEGPTYALFALSLVVLIGMFLYLKKHLPEAPKYKEEDRFEIINEVKE